MAIGVRRCFCYGFLLVLLSSALFLYLQRSIGGFHMKHIKRFESEWNRIGKIGSSLKSNINYFLHEEEILRNQNEEPVKLIQLNSTKSKGAIALLQYLMRARNHSRGAGIHKLLPSNEDPERTMHRPNGYNPTSVNEQRPACIIPKLDPFAKEARDHLKEVEEHTCHRKDYAFLHQGVLNLKKNEIHDVLIRYVKRAKDDDFENVYSDPFSIFEHEVKLKYLKTEATGCLATKDGHYLAFDMERIDGSYMSEVPLTWKEMRNCTPENYVRVLESGVIKGLMTDQCIAVTHFPDDNEDDDTTYRLEFTDDCVDEAAQFTIHAFGIAEHTDSGKCLAIKKKNTHDVTPAPITLELMSNCSSNEVQLKIADYPLKDVDVSLPVTEEFVQVIIADKDSVHVEHHVQLKAKKTILENARKKKLKKSKLAYNVAFLMFDSQSAANFERKMTKTFKFLSEDDNSIVFKGQTINGDGTTAQLCALLAGKLEEDLPEARKGRDLSDHVDNWPFIFKKFSDKRYVTMFSEDDASFASFNYRLNGFRRQPTDHYSRPFWISVQDSLYNNGCVGGKKSYNIGLNYTMSFYDTYKEVLKFSFTSFSLLFHNNMNIPQSGDDDFLKFLQEFKRKGHMGETILILFADHGLRASDFRDSIQGKLEERLPFMSVTLPSSLIKDQPEIYQAIKHNSNVLTTHFDMHATLKHILNYPMLPLDTIGQSLFTFINQSTRTCKSAGIKEHWCPCLAFSSVHTKGKSVINGVKSVLKHINEVIIGKNKEASVKCTTLTLKLIKRAGVRLPGEAVQAFEGTFQNSKCDECGISTSTKKPMKASDIQTYEFVFSVDPSHGLFEATVTKNGTRWIIGEEISRLNLYNDQPKCLKDRYPELRQFCYCR